jgi:hypothetical protein
MSRESVLNETIATLRASLSAAERERDDWMEKVVNHAYEVQVTCFRGHTYQQEFGWCPRCGADADERLSAAERRVGELEKALDDAADWLEYEFPSDHESIMDARAALAAKEGTP